MAVKKEVKKITSNYSEWQWQMMILRTCHCFITNPNPEIHVHFVGTFKHMFPTVFIGIVYEIMTNPGLFLSSPL